MQTELNAQNNGNKCFPPQIHIFGTKLILLSNFVLASFVHICIQKYLPLDTETVHPVAAVSDIPRQ